jgi:hypothetical protein
MSALPRIVWIVALAFVSLALPTAARSQLRLIPQVGLFAPASELPSPGEAVEFGKREASLAFGAALEIGSLRVAVLHATDGEVPIEGIGCEECARSTVTTATAALVIRPLPELAFVRPFVLLGGGWKRYDFDTDELDDGVVAAVLNDSNDLTAHLGLGVELGLGGLRLLVELQDLASRFDEEGVDARFQHDLFLTLGVALGG